MSSNNHDNRSSYARRATPTYVLSPAQRRENARNLTINRVIHIGECPVCMGEDLVCYGLHNGVWLDLSLNASRQHFLCSECISSLLPRGKNSFRCPLCKEKISRAQRETDVNQYRTLMMQAVRNKQLVPIDYLRGMRPPTPTRSQGHSSRPQSPPPLNCE